MRVLSALAAALCLSNGPALADPAIMVMFDTSVVYDQLGRDQAQKLQRSVIGYFLENESDFDDVEFQFINITTGRTVWTGRMDALSSDGGALRALESVAFLPGGCNGLGRAFDELEYNIDTSAADEIYIIVLSSLVDTGRPCGGGIDPFAPIPEGFSAASLLDDERIKRVSLLGVASEQKRQWFDAFRSVAERQGIAFELHDFTATEREVRLWSWEP